MHIFVQTSNYGMRFKKLRDGRLKMLPRDEPYEDIVYGSDSFGVWAVHGDINDSANTFNQFMTNPQSEWIFLLGTLDELEERIAEDLTSVPSCWKPQGMLAVNTIKRRAKTHEKVCVLLKRPSDLDDWPFSDAGPQPWLTDTILKTIVREALDVPRQIPIYIDRTTLYPECNVA